MLRTNTFLVAAALAGIGWLTYRQERLMADFRNLNAKLDQVAGIVANLQSEWGALKEQLATDATDQAAVDAAAARVDGFIGDLSAVELTGGTATPTDAGDTAPPVDATTLGQDGAPGDGTR